MKTVHQLRVPYEVLENFARRCLLAAGATGTTACTAAHVLGTTEALGIRSHGLKNLAGYVMKAQAGALDLAAEPREIVRGGARAVFDARSGLGMVAGTRAMAAAGEMARETGVGVVVVKNSTHFGAAGVYALHAAESGLIGLVVSNVDRNMTVPGARRPVLGNNPIAYAVPAGSHRPVLFDIALSAVASLKVVAAKNAGNPVPPGWIVDGAGRPTTDPSRYPDEGAMLPMAGHKGYGLAMLVDLLTGLLVGESSSDQVPSWLFQMDRPNDVTHTFIALDPRHFDADDDYGTRVEEYLNRIHEAPLAEGAREILHPGQLEWRTYDAAMADGVIVEDQLAESLGELAKLVDTPAPWQ